MKSRIISITAMTTLILPELYMNSSMLEACASREALKRLSSETDMSFFMSQIVFEAGVPIDSAK